MRLLIVAVLLAISYAQTGFDNGLVNLGGSGCTPRSQCDVCQGDCDSDADCYGRYKCFQRDFSYQIVPGCQSGGSGDVHNRDYCYDPDEPRVQWLVSLGGSGCTPQSPCGLCTGDCDSDLDCRRDYKCFQRDYSSQIVPGCIKGGSGDVHNRDYCYDPEWLVNLGGSGCTPQSQCDVCEGDCDSDADCMGGYKCFQRDYGEKVPGCFRGGSGDERAYDYCYDPAYRLEGESEALETESEALETKSEASALQYTMQSVPFQYTVYILAFVGVLAIVMKSFTLLRLKQDHARIEETESEI